MATVSIELSPADRRYLEEQVAARRLRSPAQYVASLIAIDRLRRQRDRIDALIQEAELSGPTEEWSAADWRTIEREVFGEPVSAGNGLE